MSIVRHLLIQSVNWMSGTTGDYIVKIPPLMGIRQVSLLSASIPNTLYNITATNNTIYWTRGGALSAIIPVGAYSVTNLCLVLVTTMDSADGVETYQVSYSPVTMKISIICTTTMVLTCTSTTNFMWYEIGFNTTVDTGSATLHTADNVLQLDFPTFVLISISKISSAEAATTANFRMNFCISMSHNSQYVEVFNKNSNFVNCQLYTLGMGINSMWVRLQHPNGTSAGLNGRDWSMLLNIQLLVKKTGQRLKYDRFSRMCIFSIHPTPIYKKAPDLPSAVYGALAHRVHVCGGAGHRSKKSNHTICIPQW
jgi:hypothetical protein